MQINNIELSEKDLENIYEVASSVYYKKPLTQEQQELVDSMDVWAKEIGETGNDKDCQIASLVLKTVEPVIYNAPDALLDRLFDRGSIGEFDDYMATVNPKNTLEVHEAAKGGNVPKSYIDYTSFAPQWKHMQVETQLRYTDLRKGGFKTIANLIMFAEEALKNKMFFYIMNVVSSAITSGMAGQYIQGGKTLATADIDALSLYTLDRGASPFVLSLSKYSQALARMAGYNSFMSESMKDDWNRYGLVNFIQGMEIAGISSAIKVRVDGAEQTVLPDKVLYGFAGKIGTVDMRGQMRIYETLDNNNEVVNIKITGFEFGWCVTKPENMAKIVLTD